MRSVYLLTGVVVAALMAGCKPAPNAGTPAPPAQAPVLRIRAYINVSSGCQQDTVDLLQQLADRNAGKVQLELVDFGDGDRGARRWQDSGYTCMTIELNGSPSVEYPAPAKGEQPPATKTVTFQMPQGFTWTHEDLQEAVQAALAGKLKTVSAEAAAAAAPAKQIKTSVTVKTGTSDGKPAAEVLIGDKPAMVLQATVGGRSPAQRAAAAATALNTWLKSPAKPSDLASREVTSGWAVMAGEKTVAVAVAEDSGSAKATARSVAEAWVIGLRHAVLEASQLSP
jgi:hypothetical protein